MLDYTGHYKFGLIGKKTKRLRMRFDPIASLAVLYKVATPTE